MEQHSSIQHSAESVTQVIGLVNSLLWFSMDAFWLFNYRTVSSVCMVVVLTTGSFLCFRSRSMSEIYADIALFLWMWMNSLWMLSDLYGMTPMLWLAKFLFPLGLLLVLVSIITNKSVSAISKHFSRFRGLTFTKR